MKDYDPTNLSPGEIFWRDHYKFLKDHGYTLRKRYEPDWIPSWINTSKDWLDCEDALPLRVRTASTSQVNSLTHCSLSSITKFWMPPVPMVLS
ncbi:hypothetical protein C0989_000684 [Termitomyces sp. Mn162]|nr:hypothetical protein C0989_000684 [Termitomyces sp. Mn162]